MATTHKNLFILITMFILFANFVHLVDIDMEKIKMNDHHNVIERDDDMDLEMIEKIHQQSVKKGDPEEEARLNKIHGFGNTEKQKKVEQEEEEPNFPEHMQEAMTLSEAMAMFGEEQATIYDDVGGDWQFDGGMHPEL